MPSRRSVTTHDSIFSFSFSLSVRLYDAEQQLRRARYRHLRLQHEVSLSPFQMYASSHHDSTACIANPSSSQPRRLSRPRNSKTRRADVASAKYRAARPTSSAQGCRFPRARRVCCAVFREEADPHARCVGTARSVRGLLVLANTCCYAMLCVSVLFCPFASRCWIARVPCAVVLLGDDLRARLVNEGTCQDMDCPNMRSGSIDTATEAKRTG